MHRFFVPPQAVEGDRIALPARTAHQLVKVLRLRVGDEIEIFDGSGRQYTAELTMLRHDSGTATLRSTTTVATSPDELVLAMALIHHDRFEWVLEKATELGVSAIEPIICARSRSSGASRVPTGKLDRWRSIIVEAAEQCGRVGLPVLHDPRPFSAMLAEMSSFPSIIFHPCSVPRLLAQTVMDRPGRLRVVIGPEGGFEVDEVQAAIVHGALPATLGCRIMRAETAALAALSLVESAWENWNVPIRISGSSG